MFVYLCSSSPRLLNSFLPSLPLPAPPLSAPACALLLFFKPTTNRPARVIPDPIRGAPHLMIMCEVLSPDGEPHPTNTRAQLAAIINDKVRVWIWLVVLCVSSVSSVCVSLCVYIRWNAFVCLHIKHMHIGVCLDRLPPLSRQQHNMPRSDKLLRQKLPVPHPRHPTSPPPPSSSSLLCCSSAACVTVTLYHPRITTITTTGDQGGPPVWL